MAEPFYWPDRDGWYLWVKKPDGKRSRQRLAKSKTKAFEIWREMNDPGLIQNPTVASVANQWIGHLKNRVATSSVSQEHMENAQREVTGFLNFKSTRMRWSRLTPDSITEYCSSHSWAPSTVRKRMALLRELSTYGSKHHGLKDVLAHLVKPPESVRDYYATTHDYTALVEYTMGLSSNRQGFAMLLAAMWHTGARPGELFNAEVRHFKGDKLVLSDWKNARKTGTSRTIYLNPAARIAINRSIGTRRTGNIFLSSTGEPYTRDTIRNRIGRARVKLGLSRELVAYSFRHGYAFRALHAGIDITTLATLMGTSVKQIEKVYGHWGKAADKLSAAANMI